MMREKLLLLTGMFILSINLIAQNDELVQPKSSQWDTYVTISGPELCCNTGEYEYVITYDPAWHAFVSPYYWKITIEDGVIVDDNIGPNSDPFDPYEIFNFSTTKREYGHSNNDGVVQKEIIIRVRWNEHKKAKVYAEAKYLDWGMFSRSKNKTKHITSGTPSVPSYINAPNTYLGRNTTLSTNSVEGATGYTWYVSSGSISGTGTSVTYTPSTIGTVNVNVKATNSCGSSGKKYSSFYVDRPPLTVNIIGPSKGDNSGTYTWTASASGGYSPYSYIWYYGYDGQNYNNVFGTGRSVTAQLPLDRNLYLKCKVTDNNNNVTYGYHLTLNMGSIKPKILDDDDKDNTETQTSEKLKIEEELSYPDNMIYPNPSMGIVNLSPSLTREYDQIIVYNSSGIEILNNSINEYSESIDLTDQKPGLYFVKFINDKDNLTIKLIIK